MKRTGGKIPNIKLSPGIKAFLYAGALVETVFVVGSIWLYRTYRSEGGCVGSIYYLYLTSHFRLFLIVLLDIFRLNGVNCGELICMCKSALLGKN